jgi:hypothetical protein
MSSPAPQERPRRHPDTAFRAVGDEGGLVVIPGRAEVKVLNPVAIKVYSLLDGSRTRHEIADAVLEEFEADRDDVVRDIDAFLNELQEQGMLLDTATGAGGDR